MLLSFADIAHLFTGRQIHQFAAVRLGDLLADDLRWHTLGDAVVGHDHPHATRTPAGDNSSSPYAAVIVEASVEVEDTSMEAYLGPCRRPPCS